MKKFHSLLCLLLILTFASCNPNDDNNTNMDDIQWEKKPLVEIANNNQLSAYKHTGFWKCMDALRDRIELETLWADGNAPWKTW